MSKLLAELEDGFHGTIEALLIQVNRGVTAKGAPYLSFVLQDKSGRMDAKYWNVSEEQLHQYKAGMVVRIFADVLSHHKQLQVRINKMEIIPTEDVDISLFVKEGRVSKDELKTSIFKILENMKNENIKRICLSILHDYEQDFFIYPAAKRNHHDFVGGLATHVLGMMKLAKFMANQYPLLNEDLLLSGVLLHDIGKLMELSGAVITEYTVEGKLLGHISIMQSIVQQKADDLGISGEEVMLMRHMILSHHGHYEYGSPVLPLIPEAEILYLIDNIDARMHSMEKALENVEEGDFSQRIFALDNRSFYKSKI